MTATASTRGCIAAACPAPGARARPPHRVRSPGIEAFFRAYKQLPAKAAGSVSLQGWGDAAEALRMLDEAAARHRGAKKEVHFPSE